MWMISLNRSFVEDVWVSGIGDGHGGAPVILSAGSSEGDVVAWVEDNSRLGEDCIVLDFSFADGGAVVGENDELGLTWT